MSWIKLAWLRRIHLMQSWFGLSDPGMEEALYEIVPIRQFAHLPDPDGPSMVSTGAVESIGICLAIGQPF